MRTKSCLDCQTDFQPTGPKAKRCPACQKTYRKAYQASREAARRAADPERAYRWVREHRAENEVTRSARLYGLSKDEVQAMWARPCDLCGKEGRGHIDHDHATDRIRGKLCSGCNTGLGKLGDTVEGLERALAYLRRT